jgi:biopolymer transport protein ExbB
MKTKINKFIILSFIFSGFALGQDVDTEIAIEPTDIEILLDLVEENTLLRTKDDQDRLNQFIRNRNQQQKLLNDARWLLKLEKDREAKLTKNFEDNDARLSDLEEQLNLKIGTLGETFGVVRQISGDAKSNFSQSLTNLQFPNRIDFLADLAERKALPSVPELEKLWFTLLNEIYESGKVVKFDSPVLDTSGDAESQEVLRIGQFNAISDRRYLRFIPEQQILEFLEANPPSTRASVRAISSLENNGYAEFAIDPTRGSLLSLILQNPGFFERINQGGLVGYLILIILLFGLAMGGMRFRFLVNERRSIDEELSSGSLKSGSPLYEINEIISDASLDQEKLENKIEAVLSNTEPVYEKNLSTVKLLAAVAPLLGLLGTVIGMIETFQAITLFGTGDPKLMADGISQALVTTMLGLITAVPLLFVHNQLDTRSREIVQIIEEQAIGRIAAKSN